MNKLIWFVVYLIQLLLEILIANIQVIKRIFSSNENLTPALFIYESNLKSDFGLFLLANSITLTPGTLTISVEKKNSSDEPASLLVHSLHCENIEDMKKSILNDFEVKIGRFTK